MEADAAREEQHYAKVQAVREQQAEDDAFQEEQSFDRDHAHTPPDSADGELGASLEATADSSGEVHAANARAVPLRKLITTMSRAATCLAGLHSSGVASRAYSTDLLITDLHEVICAKQGCAQQRH